MLSVQPTGVPSCFIPKQWILWGCELVLFSVVFLGFPVAPWVLCLWLIIRVPLISLTFTKVWL